MGFIAGARRRVVLLSWLLLVLAACAAAPAWGRTVLDLDTARQPVDLQDWGDYWIDPTGSVAVEGVAASTSIPWKPTQASQIHPLTTGHALWVRFTIPPAPDAERWYLEIPYPSVNRVSLYTQDGAGKWVAQTAGDLIPVADWPVPHRHPLLPVLVSAEEPRAYLLRVENPHAFGAPLQFVSESYLGLHEQSTSLILGIYFGLAGLAVAVGFLSAVSLRDSAYGFYALGVLLMGMSQASMTGIAGLHLWPHWPAWTDVAPMIFPVLTVGSLVWFFSATASIPERSMKLHRLLTGLALFSLAIAVGIVLIEPSLRFKLMIPYIVIANLITLPAIAWAVTRGDRYALWLLCGMAPVIIGAAFPMAKLWGLLPANFLTMYGMQVGIAVELPVMLVILMVRSQQRRDYNRRIQGLDRIDPATGLINGHVFVERLDSMMSRSARLKFRSAVLLVDIVNLEQVRRDFGNRAAEELPLRVAGRLLSVAREIDGVARLSALRFGMLVEGPLTDEEAASIGPRVVAHCLMPQKGKPVDWVAQVRIAQTMVPTDRADAQQVVERLSALLVNVAPETKRAVFTLAS
ncbi:sensor domain-containing diguanylate cyclase [Caenimonas aquaedulcis]|uniref:Diguanylate cyclase n=1 Tax=Caenimonas aquaedulcis TaxID=2793270 RepID=A0A931H752_9BURK|nr:7TM diverse intracellular signaling domain-containing protein [Caenimonas aquaedulcis]MBG9389916.1 diguanylate cyclase [Caenimonas aquaedulcis]